MSEYHPLPAQRLAGAVRVARPTPPKSVTLMSPALDVMTDFRTIEAGTTEPNETMECANTHMMERGIRSLLVLNQDKILVGMITATDILGEKPLRFVQERRMKHNEILVADIMTPLDRMEAIPIEQVRHGKVANVIASLRNAGRQHSLVIENDPDGNLEVCGIFSLTQIEKQLGSAILPIEVARTFTEIEEALIAH
ncbi:CBS domain-containing protein [Nitrosospira sp. Nsp11]|uniref:CBS domain-containing protein n=1 Tax=Nitrosospira sp. Nsp11 TaxID=1855338 RepID=UPI00091B36FB|nr:CBS domain-containing protein [Nitrosospira sp. Nsp11]SHL13950.1 CBS domain-containing protein [Nitrosospira sp. Nsp11]